MLLKRKGDARWKQGIFIGKALTNDMFLLHCDGNMRLTRSVKAIYEDWSEHMGCIERLWYRHGTLKELLETG